MSDASPTAAAGGAAHRGPVRIDTGYEGLLPWVAARLGGSVVACERQGARRSGGRPAFFVDVAREGGALVRTYARMSRGPGAQSPFFSLAREHAVLEELFAAGIAVPEPLGVCDEPEGILLARLPGDDDYCAIADDAQRDAIDRAFVAELAKVHALDPARFERRGLAVPRTPEALAGADLAVWEEGFDRGARRPVPLVRFARGWLRRNAPREPVAPVLVQGDTGPGQFLFEGHRLTGIVDWEFAHIGDPMLDLAQIRIRDFYNPGADLSKWLALYERASGTRIDAARLRYYTVKAMLITPLALAGVVHDMHPRTDHAEWYAQDVCYQRGTAEALAEAMGIALEPVALPDPPPGERADVLALLEENLANELGPGASDAFLRHRTAVARRLATYARNLERLGPAFEAMELDDMARLLGGARPASVAAGRAAIDALVAAAGPERDEEILRYLHRHTMREERLMAGALGAGEHARLQPLTLPGRA